MKTGLTSDGHTILMDDCDFDLWLKYLPWNCGSGYPMARVPRQNRHVKLHKLIGERMGLEGEVDHKDRNKLDNRRANLRSATDAQSSANRGLHRSSTTGYKGVTLDKRSGKYMAQIMVNNHNKFLGYFDDPVDGARAYDKAAVRLFGEFACVNGV